MSTIWRRLGPWLPWLGMLVLLVLLVQTVHPQTLLVALRHAQLWLLLPIMGCGLLGLVFRGIRWHLLLKAIAAPNSVFDSILLFTAAQAALLVPGGQFLLPVLQRSQYGTLVRRSVPTILVQELIFGLLVLPAALPGVPPYHPAGWMLLLALIFNAGTAIAFLQGGVIRLILGLAKRVPFLRGRGAHLDELQQHFVTIARSPWALWGTVFDMAAIATAGFGFYLALDAIGAHGFTWIDGMAIYALGSAVGTLSALPGGVGANEDVSTLVLTRMGLAAGPAAAATLLFRVTNLITQTALGWIVLLLASRRWHLHPSPNGLMQAIRGAEQKTALGTQAGPPPDVYLKK